MDTKASYPASRVSVLRWQGFRIFKYSYLQKIYRKNQVPRISARH